MKELENMVTSIRDELNRLYETDYTDEERDEMEENGEAYDLYSYFSDALDRLDTVRRICARYNVRRELRGYYQATYIREEVTPA